MLDLSNYPRDSKFFDPDNENVICKMEDESKVKINDEFVRLKSRMHSMENVDGKENKIGKGINQNIVKNIKHEEYVYEKKWLDVKNSCKETCKEFKINCIKLELMMFVKCFFTPSSIVIKETKTKSFIF